MKKIIAYRKLLGVEKTVTLKELKTIYRNAMKASHPDKFAGNEDGLKTAEEDSKQIIEAYHFLVGINPETIANGLPEFKETTATSIISDYKYTDAVLTVDFANGSVYEFLTVPKATYVKIVNAESPARFAKRHVFVAFPYRKVSNVE